MYYYDNYGWISKAQIVGRETGVEPPPHGEKVVGEPYPKFTGYEWQMIPYVEPVPPTPPRKTILTKLEAMDRFTDSELAAIYTAAKSDVRVEVWLDKFKIAQEIDLENASFVAGVNSLEALGLIGPGRAAEILA